MVTNHDRHSMGSRDSPCARESQEKSVVIDEYGQTYSGPHASKERGGETNSSATWKVAKLE